MGLKEVQGYAMYSIFVTHVEPVCISFGVVLLDPLTYSKVQQSSFIPGNLGIRSLQGHVRLGFLGQLGRCRAYSRDFSGVGFMGLCRVCAFYVTLTARECFKTGACSKKVGVHKELHCCSSQVVSLQHSRRGSCRDPHSARGISKGYGLRDAALKPFDSICFRNLLL